MSIVIDRINSLKHQLNTLTTSHFLQPPETLESESLFLSELHNALSTLSAPARTTPSLAQITRLIMEVNQAKLEAPETITQNSYTKDLEWLFLARCTVDVYGSLLEQLFQQTLPLGRDIFYWDAVLSHPMWRLLFLVQSCPLRLT
jgi:nuclear-control-of-ATPase protein 2